VQTIDMEVGRIAEHHARHGDSDGRSAKCGNRNAMFKATNQFFQHKNRTGNGGVECGGQAGTRAGGEQHTTVWPAASKGLTYEAADTRAHLHGGSLAAKRQAGTDG
jgi:hypothetical protein